MPRTPLLGAIVGLSFAAWLVAGFARADEATPPASTSEARDTAAPEAPVGSSPAAVAPAGSARKPGELAPVRFDEKTHFSLSWVRLPGAEDCLTGKKLSRA